VGFVTSYVFSGNVRDGLEIDRFRKKKPETDALKAPALSADNEPQERSQPRKEDDEEEGDEKEDDADKGHG
jgi:hypothetical protein